MKTTPPLILGLGNLLCTDDGAGVAAVARLLKDWAPAPGVRVLDGGTLGMMLLPLVDEVESLIIVDAIRDGDAAPGTLVRLTGAEVAPAAAERLSVHQIGVTDLLDGANVRQKLPKNLVLLGVVPLSIELGVNRTPPVEAAIDGLVQSVLDQAAAWGHPFERRAQHDPAVADLGLHPVVTRAFGL